MDRNKDSILVDIKENPSKHKHSFEELCICCTVGDVLDSVLMEAHSKFVSLGTNGGVQCDVTVGPCACGAWH